MVYVAIDVSLKSNLFEVLPTLNAFPWFQATIIDFYFNISIFASWMFYKENSIVRFFLWLVSFVCLGAISTAFYVFLQLMKVKEGDSISKVLLRGDES